MKSDNVTLKAQATYKGHTYTKLYDIRLRGCDVENCIK